MLSCCVSRNCSALLILGPTPNATRKRRRTPRHPSCEFPLFQVLFQNVNAPDRLSCWLRCSNGLVDSFQTHGLRAHQQLSLPSAGWAVTAAEPGAVSEAASGASTAPAEGSSSKGSHICFSECFWWSYLLFASLTRCYFPSYRPFLLKGRTHCSAQTIVSHPRRTAAKRSFLRLITNWMTP